MRLTIDNTDYSAALDSERLPKITRRLNQPDELRAALIAASPLFVVPAPGARVLLERDDGSALFTGYVTAAPEHEYLGWSERGPAYRYALEAAGDEAPLDAKMLSRRPPFVLRSAGGILRLMTEDLLPGQYELAGVEDVETIPYFTAAAARWSQVAAALCLRARCRYRAQSGAITFQPVGDTTHLIEEGAPGYCPQALKLRCVRRTVNDLTVVGHYEPAAYVKDYFIGDGITLNFPLSHMPFTRRQSTIVEDEYAGSELDARLWTKTDPGSALSVAGGALNVNGGTGADGGATVCLNEKLEIGGALLLQHGAAAFSGPSDGVLGGLYDGAVAIANCVAGFRVTPSGGQSAIRALVNGAESGTPLATAAGHRYFLTTRIHATEFYRQRQVFHSSLHPAGAGRGGEAVGSGLRLVLEVHDVDPANPGSEAAVSTVLYDGVLPSAPGHCTYATVNAASMQMSLAFTRIARQISAEVRSAFPGQDYKTRLVGYISEGGECRVFDTPELHFHAEHVPASGEKIKVSYRAGDDAMARVTDPASIAALATARDDGVRAAVIEVKSPPPNTSADCENAALALYDDINAPAWSGSYRVWSDFLGADAQPGDAVAVSVASRDAEFSAIVREVEIEAADPAGDRCRYLMRFANEAATALGLDSQPSTAWPPESASTIETAGASFAPDLPDAEILAYDSVSVTLDAGCDPPAGGGIEVRRSDAGWGTGRERNLAGRFTTRTFTITRLSRTQDCYLRQYDAQGRYSRYSTALHLDCPL